MAGNEAVFQKAMSVGHSAAWDQLWEKAAESYRDALTEIPDNPKALSSLGLALYHLQKFDEALQTYTVLAKVSPNDPIPFEKIAQLSERMGAIKKAVLSATKAADLYLSQKDVNKAIENWSRVTQLDSENILAHSRLALVHERLGHEQQAVTEYIALASLMQRAGKVDKATGFLSRALKIMPKNQAAQQAQALLSSGQLLPKPVRRKGATGPLRMAQVKKLNTAEEETLNSPDPVTEASKKALMVLAEILFEYSDESGGEEARKGLQAIMHGAAHLSLKKLEQTKVVLHLGQAIDAQSKNQDNLAADELAQALLAGFEHPALYFDLGMLRAKGKRYESALPHLQHAVSHVDFGLAARLLTGDCLEHLGRITDASLEYLEALKTADLMIASEEQVVSLRQLYEPLIEAQSKEEDEKKHQRFCENVREMLMRDNWREYLLASRKELPTSEEGMLMPLAEILVQAQSSEVLGAMTRVHEMARLGRMRSAMDEAFEAITYAPTYLPLHSLIGDLLVKEDRKEDAIAKFDVVADAYSIRGEAHQATIFLRKIIQLAPMELSSRTKLIDQLTVRGQIDEAIQEYLNLADIYYRLAELDMARKTYTTALRAAQQGNAEHSWNVHILQHMADIDMQRLNWKRALRVFEQIRTLSPENGEARTRLIDLNLKLAKKEQALKELENYLSYLEEHPSDNATSVALLEDLLETHSSIPQLHSALAGEYLRAGKKDEAIKSYDLSAELFLEAGNKKEAIRTITKLLNTEPPNADEYHQVLAQIKAR